MTRICPIHGEYESEDIEMFGMSVSIGCPECIKKKEEEARAEEEKISKEREIERLKSMNIEPMYYDATIDTFIAETEEQDRAKKAVKHLIRTRTGKMVILGKNGTGKTHLGVAMVRVLGGAIYTMYEISTRIRATYTKQAKEDESDVTSELSSLPMLVIDEVGKTKGSDAELSWLSFVFDKRHSRKLPTAFLSNKHPKKQCKVQGGCVDCIENYIGDDIMSRCNEDGIMVILNGDDYRLKKRAGS